MRSFSLAALSLVACQFPSPPSIDAGEGTGQFALMAPTNAWVREDGTTTITIAVTRDPGFDAAISITVPQPPTDVFVTAAEIPAGRNEVMVTLTATASAGSVHVVPWVGTSGNVMRDAETQLLVAGAPGTLDTSFGTDGIALSGTGLAATSFLTEFSNLILVVNGPEPSLRRLDGSGGLDASFGTAGVLVPSFSSAGAGGVPAPLAVRLSTGRILVVARADGDDDEIAVRHDLFAKRFSANGTEDLTYQPRHHQFGTNSLGTLTAMVRTGGDDTFVGGTIDTQAYVVKIAATGAVDTSFGNQGLFTYDTSLGDRIVGLVSTADGGVVALVLSMGVAEARTSVLKVTPGGTLDTSFGGDGIVELHTVTPGEPTNLLGDGLLLDTAERIVIFGSIKTGATFFTSDAAVWRLSSDGQSDPGFDQDGVWRFGDGRTHGIAALVSDEGTGYFIAGYTLTADFQPVGLAMWHLDSQGVADTEWSGDEGIQTTLSFRPEAGAHLLARERRVVLGGGTADPAAPMTGAVRVWY